MKALIQIEFDEKDYDSISSALRVLSNTADRYDCIIKQDDKPFLRSVKGKRLFDLLKIKKGR